MRFVVALVLALTLVTPALSQKTSRQKASTKQGSRPLSTQTAVTKEGRTVLLKSDGTWEYTNDPPIDTKSADAIVDALASLNTIAGATDIGIDVGEYVRRMIDVKAKVEANLVQITKPDVRAEIKLALDAYTDAGQAWNVMTNQALRSTSRRYHEPVMFPDTDEFARRIQVQYEIPFETVDPGADATEYMRRTMAASLKPFRVMQRDTVLRQIWAAGKLRLEKASALASSSK